MKKARWYILYRRENGMDVWLYELIRFADLKNWQKRGWRVLG